jgi:biotin carboxyl carrier protein
MPAKISKIHVKKGDSVTADTVVFTIDAMKMEMPVVAENAGVVAAVNVEENALVEQGDVLLVID